MAFLKIGTFNIKNCYDKKKKIENAKILINIIEKEKIDILGTQELTKEYEKILKTELKKYKVCGGYRFGNFPFFNKYNENNIIITNKNVLNSKTIRLPWIAKKFKDFKTSIQKKSIMPRIATLISIRDSKIGKIIVLNTHIDHKILAIKQMQLDKIKKIISKYYEKYPVIMTGDFNLQLKDEIFNKFVSELEEYNLKKIIVNDKTWIGKDGNGRTIDHIFIPQNWKLIKTKVVNNHGISDHNPIIIDVEVEEKIKNNKFIQTIKEKLKIN